MRGVQRGDYVTFKVSGLKPLRNLCVRVDHVHRHATFRDLLQTHGLGKVLPGTSSLEEGVAVYYGIANRQGESYRKLERTHGVVALTVTPLHLLA